MTDVLSPNPDVRLRALETTLHVTEKHPAYEYRSINVHADADVFSDVQFTLTNGWERNVELDDQAAIEMESVASGKRYLRRCYIRRVKPEKQRS